MAVVTFWAKYSFSIDMWFGLVSLIISVNPSYISASLSSSGVLAGVVITPAVTNFALVGEITSTTPKPKIPVPGSIPIIRMYISIIDHFHVLLFYLLLYPFLFSLILLNFQDF